MESEIKRATESDFNRERRLKLSRICWRCNPPNKSLQIYVKPKIQKEYFVFFEENNLYRWADKVRDLDVEGNFPTKEDYLFESIVNFPNSLYVNIINACTFPKCENFPKLRMPSPSWKRQMIIWVLKGKHDHAKTYVPTMNDVNLAKGQIIEVLNNFPSEYERLGFILEYFIPTIIEMTPEKIYYDGVPIATTMNFENKSFGSGNISIQTGCAEDLIFPTEMEEKINKICFPPIIDEMAKKHKGLSSGMHPSWLINWRQNVFRGILL